MTQAIIDAALRSKLRDLREPVDLCDEAGRVLAHVIPALAESEYEPVPPPPLSPEELSRRKKSVRWYSSAEVLEHLEGQ
jgi:hypothetical protein